MKRYYLGIDPGSLGAYVLINEKLEIITKERLSSNPREIFESISNLTRTYDFKVICELPQPRGVNGTKSSFASGKHFGMLKAVLGILGIESFYVYPQTWSSTMFKDYFLKTSEKKTGKQKSRELAHTFGVSKDLHLKSKKKPDEGCIDAYLIARFFVENSDRIIYDGENILLNKKGKSNAKNSVQSKARLPRKTRKRS